MQKGYKRCLRPGEQVEHTYLWKSQKSKQRRMWQKKYMKIEQSRYFKTDKRHQPKDSKVKQISGT